MAIGNIWWRRWIEFLQNCEHEDNVYLRQFTQHERQLLVLGAFAHRTRNNEWSVSSKGYDHLVAGTCHSAIDSVCGKDSNGELAFVLR
jgi:hypothetical protein